jgi:hypothetical protein
MNTIKLLGLYVLFCILYSQTAYAQVNTTSDDDEAPAGAERVERPSRRAVLPGLPSENRSPADREKALSALRQIGSRCGASKGEDVRTAIFDTALRQLSSVNYALEDILLTETLISLDEYSVVIGSVARRGGWKTLGLVYARADELANRLRRVQLGNAQPRINSNGFVSFGEKEERSIIDSHSYQIRSAVISAAGRVNSEESVEFLKMALRTEKSDLVNDIRMYLAPR